MLDKASAVKPYYSSTRFPTLWLYRDSDGVKVEYRSADGPAEPYFLVFKNQQELISGLLLWAELNKSSSDIKCPEHGPAHNSELVILTAWPRAYCTVIHQGPGDPIFRGIDTESAEDAIADVLFRVKGMW